MAEAEKKNYTLGRGKIFFSRFKPGTREPEGFRYIGNTPEFNLTIESEDLPHYSSDYGVREKDDGVTLEVNRSGTLITDQISPANVALFFFGEDFQISTLETLNANYVFPSVIKGRSYFIGASATEPLGVRGLSRAEVRSQAAAIAATGAFTFTVNPSDGDTVTIGLRVYTFKTAITNGNADEIRIAASAASTAVNFVRAIAATAGSGSDFSSATTPNTQVTATVDTGQTNKANLQAITPGTAGNAITLAASAGTVTVTNMTGGAAGGGTVYVAELDYHVNMQTGQIDILPGGSIPENQPLHIEYDLAESTRGAVISGTDAVEGALYYEANNPKGDNIDYYMGYINVRPNGDYALKGDEWQQIPMSLEILKPEATAAILSQGRPVFVTP